MFTSFWKAIRALWCPEPVAEVETKSTPVTISTPASPNNEPPFTIAIIGAGIGGLTFAIGCLRKKVPYVLYESAAEYSTVGAGVGLGPNALRAMDMIHPELRSMYNRISSGNLTPGKDHVMMDAMYAEPGFGERRGWKPASFGAECYERTSAHRKDLLDILTSMIPHNTVRFNKRVKNLEQKADRVVITFEDGEVTEAAAVVGCDGVKGPTRGFVLGDEYPEETAATYSGKYVYRSIAPMKDALEFLGDNAGDSKAFIGYKHKFITFPISSSTQYNMVAFKYSDKPWTHPQWTRMVTKEEMLNDFDGVDPRLLQALAYAEPRQWALFHHMNTPRYYNNRICLLGDSAHATTPHQAAGAGQCIEDSLVLSHLLGQVKDSKNLPAVFRVYDSIRRPRAQKVVRTSQECGDVYGMLHPGIRDDMVKIAENLNRRFLWIWEHDLQMDLEIADERLTNILGKGGS